MFGGIFDGRELIKKLYPDVRIHVYGFVDFVYELINISDAVITKGGPATVMEILQLNKIPVISSYIWEQEKGNVELVTQSNVGFYEPNKLHIENGRCF